MMLKIFKEHFHILRISKCISNRYYPRLLSSKNCNKMSKYYRKHINSIFPNTFGAISKPIKAI